MDSSESTHDERNGDGRRTIDSAHLLKWIPMFALFFTLGLQTVYVVRYISAMELKQTASLEQIADLKADVKALSANFAQGAVPAAQSAWEIQQLKQSMLDNRARVSELERAASERERRVQRLEANLSATNARARAREER